MKRTSGFDEAAAIGQAARPVDRRRDAAELPKLANHMRLVAIASIEREPGPIWRSNMAAENGRQLLETQKSTEATRPYTDGVLDA